VYIALKPFFDALHRDLDYLAVHSCYVLPVASDTGYQVVDWNVASVVVAFHWRLVVQLMLALGGQEGEQRHRDAVVTQDAAVARDADIVAAGPCAGAVVDKEVDT